MNQFIGVKLINAKPMSRLEYNQFHGWELPVDENGADEGAHGYLPHAYSERPFPRALAPSRCRHSAAFNTIYSGRGELVFCL